MKVLIRRAKEERQARRENPCRVLEHPPDNGLLVPHLVRVARRVHAARERLLDGLARLVEGEDAIPVKRCRLVKLSTLKIIELSSVSVQIVQEHRHSMMRMFLARFCSEVHVGRVGHEIRTCEGRNSGARNSLHVWRPGTVRDVVGFPYCYHLFDRVGKPRVVHKEKHDVAHSARPPHVQATRNQERHLNHQPAQHCRLQQRQLRSVLPHPTPEMTKRRR